MATNEEKVRKILNDYDMLRSRAEIKRDRYVEKIYSDIPRLKKINDEINKIGFENAKNIMEHPFKSKEYNEKFNKKLSILKEEEEKLLKENDIPLNYKNPQYECMLCNDTGYVENQKCECFKKKLIEKAYDDSNLGILSNEHSFDNFSLSYYSNKRKQEDKLSDREIMEYILNSCKKFCAEFENIRENLLMIGKPGLGKTYLSNCIAKEILNKGYTVVYKRATNLFSAYEDYKFGRVEEFDFDSIYKCDLLIIDDLGSENLSKLGCSFLFDILNERFDKNKKMIINTNLTMKEISSTYSSRMTSRIYEYFKIIHFMGDDIRVKKLQNKK